MMKAESEDYAGAYAMLMTLQEGCQELFTLNRLTYLAGILAYNSAQYEAAIQHFTLIQTENPEMQCYSQYNLAESLNQLARFDEAVGIYLNLADSGHYPLPREDLLLLAAQGYEAARRIQEAEKTYEKARRAVRSKAKKQDILLALARLKSQSGRLVQAFEDYRSVIEVSETGTRSLAAYTAMKKLEPQLRKNRVSLSSRSLLAMGNAAYYGGEYEEARLYLQAAIELGLTKNVELDARFIMGRSLERAGSWSAAARIFSAITASKPSAAWEYKTSLHVARCQRGLGNHAESLAEYDRLLRQLPPGRVTGEFYYSRALTYEAANDPSNALADYWQTVHRHPADSYADDALWRIAATEYRTKNYPEFEKAILKLTTDYGDSPLHKQALFWLGKYKIQCGEYGAAQQTYATLLKNYPNTYLGIRTLEVMEQLSKTGKLALTESQYEQELIGIAGKEGATLLTELMRLWANYPCTPFRQQTTQRMKEALAATPDWRAVFAFTVPTRAPLLNADKSEDPKHSTEFILAELLFHRDWRTAERLLTQYRGRGRNYLEFEPLMTLMHLGALQKKPSTALDSALKLLTLLPKSIPYSALPATVRQALYPDTYYEYADLAAADNALDPWLILAVARTESSMNPQVVSNAGARGLMQFMSYTARDLARRHNDTDFTEDDLFDPRTSIKLGRKYLAELLAAVKGDRACALAAYNGGLHNVKRWEQDRWDETEEGFIAAIGFSETREYVQRVLNSYYQFRDLYDQPDRNQELVTTNTVNRIKYLD